MITDTELLEAALIGLQHQRSQVDERMAELRGRLDGRSPRRAADASIADSSGPGRKRRRMSASGRSAIAAAQRKRWAALKEGSAKAALAKAAPARKKRKISAEGMKRIIAATKKRWAEVRAKKAAAKKAQLATEKSAAKKAVKKAAAA